MQTARMRHTAFLVTENTMQVGTLRPIDGDNHLPDSDLLGASPENESAPGTLLRTHKTRVCECLQDLREKRSRHA
jgi:hypothetical protein